MKVVRQWKMSLGHDLAKFKLHSLVDSSQFFSGSEIVISPLFIRRDTQSNIVMINILFLLSMSVY